MKWTPSPKRARDQSRLKLELGTQSVRRRDSLGNRKRGDTQTKFSLDPRWSAIASRVARPAAATERSFLACRERVMDRRKPEPMHEFVESGSTPGPATRVTSACSGEWRF